jgi:hypothetical protein
LKLLQKNRKNSTNMDIGNYFLNRTLIAQERKVRSDKWTESNQKLSVHQEKQLLNEETIHRIEENLCQVSTGIGLTSLICKVPCQWLSL